MPLVRAGLDLVGLDISQEAISQLTERMPERAGRLVVGDLSALPEGRTYPLVVALQVLQHGTRQQAHTLLEDTLARVAPGGLVAIRVNSIGTDIGHAAQVTERAEDGSLTVRVPWTCISERRDHRRRLHHDAADPAPLGVA